MQIKVRVGGANERHTCYTTETPSQFCDQRHAKFGLLAVCSSRPCHNCRNGERFVATRNLGEDRCKQLVSVVLKQHDISETICHLPACLSC